MMVSAASRLRKNSPQPARSLLSPPGQGEKIEEGSHPLGCAQDKLLRRVLPPSGIIPALGTLFPHPACGTIFVADAWGTLGPELPNDDWSNPTGARLCVRARYTSATTIPLSPDATWIGRKTCSPICGSFRAESNATGQPVRARYDGRRSMAAWSYRATKP